MMRYCRQCVMPDTKPDLQLDDLGVDRNRFQYENARFFRHQGSPCSMTRSSATPW